MWVCEWWVGGVGSVSGGWVECGSVSGGWVECGSVSGGWVECGYVSGGWVECGYVSGGWVECGSVSGGWVECGSASGGWVECGSVSGGWVECGYVSGVGVCEWWVGGVWVREWWVGGVWVCEWWVGGVWVREWWVGVKVHCTSMRTISAVLCGAAFLARWSALLLVLTASSMCFTSNWQWRRALRVGREGREEEQGREGEKNGRGGKGREGKGREEREDRRSKPYNLAAHAPVLLHFIACTHTRSSTLHASSSSPTSSRAREAVVMTERMCARDPGIWKGRNNFHISTDALNTMKWYLQKWGVDGWTDECTRVCMNGSPMNDIT